MSLAAIFNTLLSLFYFSITAEEALSQRRLETVEDLNLGDLAIYLECSLAFAMNTMKIDDYPGLKRVYELMLMVPEFQDIDEKFRGFGNNILSLQAKGSQPSLFEKLGEVWTSVKFISYMKWNGISMTKNIDEAQKAKQAK